MLAAQNAAHEAGNAEITPDHLLLGVLSDAAALATVLLRLQKVDTEAVRVAATAAIAALRVEAEPPQLIPFNGRARKALELSVREALRLGHNYVGTEHQLLVLLELEGGSSDQGPLRRCGVDKDRVEADLITALQSLAGGNRAAPGPAAGG
ncbi:hypothetical protein MMAN_04060 [Mycobacterium mantenii]|uniref:Clp R domain-containing protein n=1 Tax=Mycobacterium mantenii TaxID=560555 RepID=A0ABN6A404_MYCNT|nr:hypothetical protein MMAN_04060 [Mycobacterium mantenii]